MFAHAAERSIANRISGIRAEIEEIRTWLASRAEGPESGSEKYRRMQVNLACRIHALGEVQTLYADLRGLWELHAEADAEKGNHDAPGEAQGQ